jgi:hypothetical protein
LFSFDFVAFSATLIRPMSKTITTKPIKGWKPFRLADGTTRLLPEWADRPLKFAFSPDEALRRGAYVKPQKGRGKAVRAQKLA